MRVLVTGARGLLGGATARALLEAGHEVRTLQRTPSQVRGVEELLGDVTDPATVQQAVAGCEAVVHLAATVAMTGSDAQLRRVNVGGTKLLLAQAQAAGVGRFVYVSSPSVANDGSAAFGAGAEPADPASARNAYSRSKGEAELAALGADAEGFRVVAVRPHLVWGPGDTQFVARIVARARRGRLVLIRGGRALVDTTYVDNAADALVAAMHRAAEPMVHGRAFVVSNGEPRTVREILTRIAGAAGFPGPSRSVPLPLAWAAGALVSAGWSLARRPGEPPLSPFVAEQLATAHWFDQRATREALAWTPRVGLEEGFARLGVAPRTGAALPVE